MGLGKLIDKDSTASKIQGVPSYPYELRAKNC